MNEQDDLQILLKAALDLAASIQTVRQQLRTLQSQLKNDSIKVTAALNRSASRTRISSDLKSIKTPDIKISGKLDNTVTRQQIRTGVEQLKTQPIKLQGALDVAATNKTLKQQMQQIPVLTTTASIKTEGAEQIENLRKRMDETGNSAAGLAGKVYLARSALHVLRQTARETIETITELDTAVTNLGMATGESREKTYGLLKDYNKMAGQLGAVTAQVADAADQWLRQGHSIADTTTLIGDSMILSKVSQLDSAAATEYLTSAMRGYQIAAQDVIGVVDKLTAVDLKSATDAGGLAEAMSRTAVTADMAGISMDRLLGYLAAVGETTQKSMSTVGESFKTIFSRMNDIKANKLELVDEDGTTEILSDVELTLKNVGIDLRKTVNEYDNYGTVLDNLAAKWNTLSRVQLNALVKAFAGTRRGEDFRVLMENYSSAMEYMDIAADSAGTAMEKFSLYQESIEAKAASFTAAVEGLVLDTVDAGFIGDLVDAGTAVIEFTEKIDLLKAALVGLGAGGLVKSVTAISDRFLTAKQNIQSLGTALQTLRKVDDVGKMSADTIQTLGALSKNLSDDQLRLVLTSRQLSTSQMQAILTASGLTEAEVSQKIATLGLATAQGTATVATGGFSASMLGLGAALKTAFAANPIGMIMLGASAAALAVKGVTALYDAITVTAEEAYESAEEFHNSYAEVTKEVENLNSELDQNKARLSELYKLSDAGTITLVEQEELERLQKTNAELETTIARKKEIAAMDAKEANAGYVKSYNKTTFTSNARDILLAEQATIYEQYGELLEKYDQWSSGFYPETEWMDGELEKAAELKNRLFSISEMINNGWNYDTGTSLDNTVGYADHVKELVSTYNKLNDLQKDGVALSAAQKELFESTRTELVGLADTFDDDFLSKYYGDDEHTEEWQSLLDMINKTIYATEYFAQKLTELPSDCYGQMKDLGREASLTADKVNELAENFPELKDWMSESGKTAEDIAAHFNVLSIAQEEASAAADDYTDKVSSLADVLSNLSTVSGNMDKLSKVLGSFTENGVADIDALSGLSEVFGDLSSFEDFVNVMNDSASTMADVQDACNRLAAEYIDASHILDDLDDSTAKVIERQLEEMGVLNAHEIVQARLNAIELEGQLAAKGLADAEWEVAEETLKASGANDIALASLKRLRQEQYNAKLAATDLATATASTISSLITQAQAAGVAAESIAGLSKAQSLQKRFELGTLDEYEANNFGDLMALYTKEAKAAVENLGSITLPEVKVSLPKNSSSSKSSAKEIEEYVASIDEYREALERLRKAQEERANIKSSIDETEDLNQKIVLEKQLISAYEHEQDALDDLNHARSATIAQGVDALRELGFAVDYNVEANELWISNMEHLNELTADSKGEYGTLQEATNALRKDTEGLIKTLEDLNDENRDGASTWRELKGSIKEAKIAIVNGLQEIADKASAAVDDIQDVYKVLHDAADEFAANDGFITVDTWQALRDIGMEYMQLLVDENGVWKINEERINAVIAARTRQMAIENAMSYVERIKLATQEDSIENLNDLIYVTTDAANATWGLAKAELELLHIRGLLDDSQYQAALHNIQVMYDLAENAIQNIGKETGALEKKLKSMREELESTKDSLEDLLDELEDMQDGAGDLIDYIMDMLKHRINQQIDLLEEMKDKYSEIIDLKKKSLDATKDEQDYQKTIAKKLKEMAKLQERINALSLDNSRESKAEQAKLLEELAELQEDLAATQADKSIEAQKDALDQMEEDYHAEKDKEIEILENSISSTQKLYSLALDYIRSNWGTLFSELIEWNTQWGTSLNAEISEAWAAAESAAQRYGDFVAAIMGGISNEIDSITRQIESLNSEISNLNTSASISASSVGASNGSSGTTSTVVGNVSASTAPSNEEMIHRIIKQMYDNMNEHGGSGSSTSAARKAELSQENLELGALLSKYGVSAYRSTDKEDLGTWYTDRSKSELLFDKYRKYIYHTGGFVGKAPLKPNERYIRAENGELVLTSDQQNNLLTVFDRINTMVDSFTRAPVLPLAASMVGDLSGTGRNTINNITNNSRPIEISIGDTIIQGNASSGTVQKHTDVTRNMMNDIGNMLRRLR